MHASRPQDFTRAIFSRGSLSRYARRTKRKRDFLQCRSWLPMYSEMGFFKTSFSSSDVDWWRCILVNTQGLPTSYMYWFLWPLGVGSDPKVSWFIAGLFPFFHDTLMPNSKHPTPALWYPANTAAPHSIPLLRAKREESRRLSSRFASSSGRKWEAAVFAGLRYNFWKKIY